MKQVLYIFLIATALCACNRTSRENCNESVLDIIDNASYGDTHASSTWANRKWEFFGKPGDDNYEALTNNISVSEFNDLAKLISEEFGEPTYDKLDFPEELIPDADTGTFWMAW